MIIVEESEADMPPPIDAELLDRVLLVSVIELELA